MRPLSHPLVALLRAMPAVALHMVAELLKHVKVMPQAPCFPLLMQGRLFVLVQINRKAKPLKQGCYQYPKKPTIMPTQASDSDHQVTRLVLERFLQTCRQCIPRAEEV